MRVRKSGVILAILGRYKVDSIKLIFSNIE